MVPLGRKKDLGLLLQAAERLAVDNAVAVPLVARADGVLVLRAAAAPGGLAQGGIAAQGLALDRLVSSRMVMVSSPLSGLWQPCFCAVLQLRRTEAVLPYFSLYI